MKVKLNNVRLSYPNLWKARSATPGSEAKFSASLVMDKTANAADIKAIQDAIDAVCTEQWKDKSKWPKGDKVCLRDGSTKDSDGYGPTVMFVSANNSIRVPVVDKDPSVPLTQEDGRPYAGCYVNAVIRLWAQDNDFGRRVNCQLCGIQFWADGEAFGDKPADALEMFGDGKNQDQKDDEMFEVKPPENTSGGSLQKLKDKLRAEPEWGVLLKADSVKQIIRTKYKTDLAHLTEEMAKDALEHYQELVDAAVDPFVDPKQDDF
jgi:hypothetical protein